jgi:glycosyltransferase involved in cell wall biosynthesis
VHRISDIDQHSRFSVEVFPRPQKKDHQLMTSPRKTLILPVYKNAENIPDLLAATRELAGTIESLEIIFVIDGSPDESGPLLIDALPAIPCPCKVVFHSRNFGEFTAIRTGMEFASGDQIAVMAADLQEPPELVPSFFEILDRNEADVVFGVRTGRDDPPWRKAAANAFWASYKRIINPDIPKGGVDMFACNRAVRDAVLSFSEPNSSLVAQLFWVGFRRSFVPYKRRKRMHGESAWDFRRRLRYMMDSIFSYSDAPIMFILWIGIVGCAASLLYALITVVMKLFGAIPVQGFTMTIVFLTFLGSAILLTQGLIGCYLWRALENTKRRPLRLIANVVASDGRENAKMPDAGESGRADLPREVR